MLLNVVEIEKYYGTRNNLKKALACFFTVHEHCWTRYRYHTLPKGL